MTATRSGRRQRGAVLLVLSTLVFVVCGCRAQKNLSPELESELGTVQAATIPENATALVKGDVESIQTGIRVGWQFRMHCDAGEFLGDVERRLRTAYRCRQEPLALRCAKALPGDHLDLEMIGIAVPDGATEWRVELKCRPD